MFDLWQDEEEMIESEDERSSSESEDNQEQVGHQILWKREKRVPTVPCWMSSTSYKRNKYFFNLVIVQLWMNVEQQRRLKI